ncbi:MAG TPA: ATP-binding protein [Bacteroidales bacterium]|nr:ATP-binding protein [Bacteroidales bacterium]HQB20895.1 ATP-binding protein [Bacteroidales bacterium]
MLLEFSVGNFLSFRERKTLNLVASSINDYKEANTINSERHVVLKGAVIYGANASGKSNFVRAMSTMRRIVLLSFYQSSTKDLGVTPFLLNTETEQGPSYFEVLFEAQGIRYRYGFEVTNKEVIGEWLYESKKNVEKFLFLREKDGIEVAPSYKEAENLESKTRDNALFLSVIDQFNGVIAKRIMNWFNNFITISGLTHEKYELVTFEMLGKENTANILGSFYNQLDLGFEDLSVSKEKFNPKRISEDTPESLVKLLVKDLEGAFRFKIKTMHEKYDNNNNKVGYVEFDMRSQESAGTNKVFNISGPIFDVLQKGGVLAIDELDSSLHPLMTLAITRLFNSKKDNSKNAQLIFTTHDTNLFSYGKYRRDQIYFVEKDKYGASDLYSLVEYREEDGKKVRKDRSFEKDYIQGRYGAVPYIGDFSKIILEWQKK